MREIKFRGKCTPEFPHPTVKWVYGSLVSDSKKKKKTALICVHLPVPTRDGNSFWYEVNADTVGQFTGLHDSDGREIYEGDVLNNSYGCLGVSYKQEWAAFVACWVDKTGYYHEYLLDEIVNTPVRGSEIKVIGNIHDNPSLLEREL